MAVHGLGLEGNLGEVKTGLMKRIRGQRGATLIETLIAIAILLITVAGLLGLFSFMFNQNESQGDLASRTCEYAQDKMEQLLNLSFNDGTTDTTVYPANPTGCTGTGTDVCGLGGTMAASSTAGSIPPATAVSKYVDYLDANGNLLTSYDGAFYTRQWSITTDSTGNLKTITVVATSFVTIGRGLAPSTKLVCIKANGL